jgi:hypothetical protein
MLSLSPASAGLLLGLLFDPEDVDRIFLETLGCLQTTWRCNSEDLFSQYYSLPSVLRTFVEHM